MQSVNDRVPRPDWASALTSSEEDEDEKRVFDGSNCWTLTRRVHFDLAFERFAISGIESDPLLLLLLPPPPSFAGVRSRLDGRDRGLQRRCAFRSHLCEAGGFTSERIRGCTLTQGLPSLQCPERCELNGSSQLTKRGWNSSSSCCRG